MTSCFVNRIVYPVQKMLPVSNVGNGIVLIAASVIGIHKFPSVPTITTEIWNAVQKLDVARLALSTVDGCVSSQEQWTYNLHPFS